MDNRYRMYISLFIIIVSAVLYSWAESQQIDQLHATDLLAWTGETLDLHCGIDQSEPVNRYWKKGEEILTMGDVVWTRNNRIDSLNQSNILRINNVNVDDEGLYTCIVNSTPVHELTFNLQVKEFTCDPPDQLINGEFKGESSSTEPDTYKVNDQIQYFCNRGFELVGEVIRTCSGPPHGWIPHQPSCEPDYIVRLQKSMSVIGNKMTVMENKITAMENRMMVMEDKTTARETKCTKFENKITTVDSKITTIENIMISVDIRMTKLDNRMTAMETRASPLPYPTQPRLPYPPLPYPPVPYGHKVPDSRWRGYDDSDELFD